MATPAVGTPAVGTLWGNSARHPTVPYVKSPYTEG